MKSGPPAENIYIPYQKNVVYGPVNSRRLGTSLGINILPPGRKVCNLDCLYCFYGSSDTGDLSSAFPSVDHILSEVEEALIKGSRLDYITFSGNGSASLHPEFLDIVKGVADLRDQYYPGIPTAILSNSAGIGDDKLAVFERIDLPIMKLDAGDEKMFKRMNRPAKGITFSGIVNTLSRMRGITLQTLFAGGIDNHKGKAFDNWIEVVRTIDPANVQIYTMHKSVPELQLLKIPDNELSVIAGDISKKLGFPVKAYY